MIPLLTWYCAATFLEAEDPDKDISLYINSPGGSVSAGLAIYDTMQHIRADVSTICVGLLPVWEHIFSCWEKGKRFALPRSYDSPALVEPEGRR